MSVSGSVQSGFSRHTELDRNFLLNLCRSHACPAGAGDRRPLHRAAGGNHVEICRYLIEKGAKVDQPDKSGRTALHWAAISGHKEAAELLVASGACVVAVTL